MVFNFKKTFTLRPRVKDEDRGTVVCLHYIRNAEFDTNYIISTGKRDDVEINKVKDIKWNDVFTDKATTNGNSFGGPEYENLKVAVTPEEVLESDKSESIPDIKPNAQIEVKATKPRSILKKSDYAASTETIHSENDNKPTLTFVSNKDYDGPSEEFTQKKQKVSLDETRTERRDTKAVVALKKARAKEEKERLKEAMEMEARESDEVREENEDVTYKTRMSMMYSSQASSIFFTQDEPEADDDTQKVAPEDIEKVNQEIVNEYDIIDNYEPKLYEDIGIPSPDQTNEVVDNYEPKLYEDVSTHSPDRTNEVARNEIGENSDDHELEVYEEVEVLDANKEQPKKKKMSDAKKNKHKVKNIKMKDGDNESVGSNTSA